MSGVNAKAFKSAQLYYVAEEASEREGGREWRQSDSEKGRGQQLKAVRQIEFCAVVGMHGGLVGIRRE